LASGDRLALDAILLALDRDRLVTFSVTMYLRRRAGPVSRCAVPTRSSSSERVIAASVSRTADVVADRAPFVPSGVASPLGSPLSRAGLGCSPRP
jgi:hypothetical protein